MSRLPLTPDQAALSDRIYQSLRQAADSDLRALADLLASKPDHQLLGPDRVRGPRPGPQDRGQGLRDRPGGAEKGGYQGSSLSCPHCHESARFVDYRPKTVQSLVGTFPLERAYYHCRPVARARSPGTGRSG